MVQPEADYTIDFSDAEREMLRERQDELKRGQVVPAAFRAPVPANADVGTDRELAQIQAAASAAQQEEAAVEGTVAEPPATGNYVEYAGKKFRVAEKLNTLALLKFSAASEMSLDDPRAMSAMYALLRSCIYRGTPPCGKCEHCKADRERLCESYDPGDWGAFEDHALNQDDDPDALFAVVSQVLEIISGRPTAQPQGSSPGRRGTRGGSTGNSSGRRGRASRR